MELLTRWIDGRIDRLAQQLGVHIADRIVERTGLDNVSEQYGSWLLGLNSMLSKLPGIGGD
ncbi:MAG: hypothetical protein ACPGVG_11785 [Mycobacterium sp.]